MRPVTDNDILEAHQELVKQVVELRKEHGVSQSRLGDICGLKQPVIARMEANKTNFTIDTLLRAVLAMDGEIVIFLKE